MGGDMPDTDTILGTMPNEAAAEWLRGKALADARVFREMLPEVRARAFAVSGIEDMRRLREVREAVARIPEGGSWEEAREKVAGALGDPESNRARAELVVRTNAFQAYSAARWRSQMADKEVFPYLKYVTVGDDRVRDSHRRLDGIVLRKDDKFWEDHYPPWDWGCRCIAVELTEGMAEEERREGDAAVKDAAWSEDWRAAHSASDKARDFHNRPGQLTVALDEVASDADGKERYTREEMAGFNARMERKTVARERPDGSLETLTVREWMWEPVRRKAEAEVLAAGRDRKEHVAVRDWDTGGEIPVRVVEADGRGARFRYDFKPGQSVAIYHNHPGGETDFSAQDATNLFRPEVREFGSTTGWESRLATRWNGSRGLEERIWRIARAVQAARAAGDADAERAAEAEWRALYGTLRQTGVIEERRVWNE